MDKIHEITVVNKYLNPHGEYIGRGSPLGNPFVIGRDGDRAEVIAKYVEWLPRISLSHTAQGQVIRNELKRLYELAKEKPINLVCFCKPQACHGDVIKEILIGHAQRK